MSDEVTQPAAGEQEKAGASDARALDDTRIAELSRESAAYRTGRNEALRRAHAYETILKAHGIDVSGVTSEALSGLPISGGKVDGVYAYTPPKIEVPRAPEPARAGDDKPPLTLDEVRKWPADEINRRWTEVKGLMEKK